MRKLFLIVHSNMRKAKGQTVAIVMLILLAAIMLNLWLMLSMDYKKNFVRYHDKLNAEHVTLTVDNDTSELRAFLLKTLEEDSHIYQYQLVDCMQMVGTFPYNNGTINSEFVIMSKPQAMTRSIGKIEIVENGEQTSGVYLPMLYKTKDIAVGKTIEISIGSNTVSYTVCGFFNSIMMGSHNCSLTQMVLTEDKYTELKTLGYAPSATLCSIRLNDKSENLNYEATLKSIVSEQFPTARMLSNCYNTVSQSRYISQMICSGILSAMAFIVLLIAIVIIVSNIINYIQVNIVNLGVLKAVGYTSGQLICSLLLQFLGITLVATIAGIGISYGLFPAVNRMMISQTGIPYTLRFLPLPLLISLLILGGTVAFAVWVASHRIKKIEPILALRYGIQTHNFKKNHIPLEKTKAPLNFALALKTTFSSIKNNITICITMFALSLIVVFSGLMTENVIWDMNPFINLIVGETSDSCINIKPNIETEFLQVMEEDSRVEKVYMYSSLYVSHAGGAELMATLCDDFSKANNQDVIFKGRFPKYANELAIAAKYAKEQGLKIGNEIEITINGNKEKYLISGFTQLSNHLGKDCLMTREGYERLGELTDISYYINLTEKTDVNAFNSDMQQRFSKNLNTTINIKEIIDGTGSVYVTLMTIIVIAIIVLSVIIITFVLYLLVRTMLNNKKRDYGILKSLGFTTKQLILQTALSLMPALIFSTVIGLVVNSLLINPLTGLFLSGIGIVKCTFSLPIGFIVLAGIGLIIFSFGMACLLSFRIKKIAPRTLLVGE